jgi:hypothetical protein
MFKRIIAISICAVLLTSCTQPDRTVRILEDQGYTNIQTQPFGPVQLFQCSEDDTFRTPFTAESSTGRQVTGVVCAGILKGATVRFD